MLRTGKLCEAALCYTDDILDPSRTKYDLAYYVELAQRLEQAVRRIQTSRDRRRAGETPAGPDSSPPERRDW